MYDCSIIVKFLLFFVYPKDSEDYFSEIHVT